ncbi:PLP-dependent aminotransferase family protein [Paraburkholderia sp. J41]|uniref:aminotransferase-like domain-containing protein n=1 Tax=Paraburkholderia sp. J41 TaxID=2805433 RepID=UPI002AC32DA7|nr:PLP-dependent aminotransferase family protein [Paraburkholderia sp. J41]
MPLSHDDPRTHLPMPDEPLYERLAEHYRRIIRAGTLAPGDRMPSVRAFMKQHRVSLSTTLQALRRLEDAGWLLAKPRAGYFVRPAVASKLAGVQEPEVTSLPSGAQFVGLHETISRVIEHAHAFPDALNLGGATADAQLYPTARLQSLTMRLLRRRPTLLTEPGTPGGAAEFQQTMAKRALSHDVVISPDEVIVTSGGVDAVNLALRAVAQPGDTIAIESPAFFGLLQILESLGLRALEIPTSPTTGISLEALDVALSAYPTVKALVVVPHLQNPLGSVMPNERKAELVRLCARHGVAIIEDDPYSELVEPGSAARPIKSWDREGNVIYCPSLSKVFAPGMRLGWMSAGRWHSRVKMLKFTQSRLSETLPQLVAAEFIGTGDFDRHLRRLRERLRAQRDDTCNAVARYFPHGTRLSPPAGGLLLWVALPENIDSEKLFEAALAQGIRVAPGFIFSNSNRFDSFIRLSCPKPFDRDMEMAIRRLGQLVETIA